MIARRPRIYISSTIFDFSDLRSALKFYLEERGCEVLLSEFNDFGKPLDTNSYDACLKAIDSVDYFVLLVGARVGGWYQQDTRVTITRKEYQHAYTRATAGQLRLVAFVRQDIWTIREDRNELQRLCATFHEKQNETNLAWHSSKFVNDAEFVFEFLKEIGRIEEMKAAITGTIPFPAANWIHQFKTFAEIIEVLAVQLGLSKRIRRIALERNLYHELMENIRSLCTRYKPEGVLPHYQWANMARGQLRGGTKDASSFSPEALHRLSLYALIGPTGPHKATTTFIDEALRSGEFLDFDRASGRYVDTELVTVLRLLRQQIALLAHRVALIHDRLPQLSVQLKELAAAGRARAVLNETVAPIFCIHDSQHNVMFIAHLAIRLLSGETGISKSARIFRMSPFEGCDVEGATPSDAELLKMLQDQFGTE